MPELFGELGEDADAVDAPDPERPADRELETSAGLPPRRSRDRRPT